MAQLKCVYHGGKCCGIKTIYGFGYGDNAKKHMEDSLYETGDGTPEDYDKSGDEVSSDLPFFTEEAPEESTLDRLDRYLSFIEKWRPSGIVEITLAETMSNVDSYWNQVRIWEKDLLDRGFKEVNKHKNSNSGNIVHVYHLNQGE